MHPLRLALSFLLATAACAQTESAPPFRAILPTGPGAIPMHLGDGWGFEEINLYPDGPRISVFLTNEKTGLGMSYLMFANDTTGPNAEGCRKSVMTSVIEGNGKRGTKMTADPDRTLITKDGRTIAIASYTIPRIQNTDIQQKNVFAFIGDEKNCAELHLSKVKYTPSDDLLFQAEIDHFRLENSYQPVTFDYFGMATLFFDKAHALEPAALYYRSALDAFPADGPLKMRRVLTDQLSMSYGMSGDLANSRAVNEAAIKTDPAYPLYYYDLACADAESGDAVAAQLHLQQAYDRRANVLEGEKLPDASTDESILKLKKNKDFWKFVQSLPKS